MTNQSVIKKGRRQSVDPDHILSVALEVFVRDGYSGARLDEIADKAKVAKGTIYLYFPSKEDLFRGVVRHFVVPRINNLRKAVDEFQGSMADFLREHLVKFWMHVLHSELCAVVRLVFSEGARFPDVAELYYQEAIERGLGAFTEILKLGAQRGEFRTSSYLEHPQILLAPVLTALFWQSLYAKKHPLKDEEYLSSFADLLLYGLVRGGGNAG